MIKKLKIKFVCINMALLTALLFGIFVSIYIITANNAKNETVDMMNKVVQNYDKWINAGQSDENITPKEDSYRAYMMKTVFFVKLNSDNTVAGLVGQYSLDDTEINTVIASALADSKNTGIIADNNNLRYLITGDQDNKIIAFADRTDEIDTLEKLLRTCLVVGGVSLFFLFFISIFFAARAVQPIEKTWQQQRRFIADASHELKTPLTVILANTDIILSHKNGAVNAQEKWLNGIKNEAQRMAGLVGDLLFLAKSDDSADAPVFSDVNLSDIVWTCLLSFESVIYEKGKKLESDIASGIFVYGNEERLKQLLIILLDNAVKYSNEKGTVTVKLKEERDKIQLSVHNTGAPIDANQLPHIFDRFYRADEAHGAGGHGLGLAIAERIAENHNGKITVKSAKEYGTAFFVSLPGRKNN